MSYYIKVTGRGYLKYMAPGCPIDYQSKFTKQLTLAYAADTSAEAEAYKQKMVVALKDYEERATLVFNVAQKVICFPEMFSSASAVLKFIHKQGVTKKIDNGYNYGGLYYTLTRGLDTNYNNLSYTELMKRFESTSYSGFNGVKSLYNSAKHARRVVTNSKIVEETNNIVTVTKAKPKGYKFNINKSKGNERSDYKEFCSTCGASIPGGKYLIIGSNAICPYCIAKFGDQAKQNIQVLGDDMAKSYKKALFIKNL